MDLDKKRVEKIIQRMSDSAAMTKLLRGFFGSAAGSHTYEELGTKKEYICYVLKAKGDSGNSNSGNSSQILGISE